MKKMVIIIVLILISPIFTNISNVMGNNKEELNKFQSRGGKTLIVGPGQIYTKMQDAVDNASSGDIIRVYDGMYYGNIFLNKTLTLIGNGSEKTIINANNTDFGIFINASWCNISGFRVTKGGYYSVGIVVFKDNNKIEKCNCSENFNGIQLSHSNNNTIQKNICVLNKYYGIATFNSNNNIIYNNSCKLNDENGIKIFQSNNNMITHNICDINNESISLYRSNNNKITWNKCYSRHIEIEISESNNNLISDNICNKKPYGISRIKYIRSYGIYLFSSNNNTISNNICTSHEAGISLDYICYNNMVSNNTCNENNISGIRVELSAYNIIVNNTCNSNQGDGIVIEGNTYYNTPNKIINNICNDNSKNGIFIHCSSNNVVSNNTCIYNRKGLSINYFSRLNNIIKNIFMNNSGYGAIIFDTFCDSNSFYNNSFINNNNGDTQACDNSTGNDWNSTIKGNHWSDWIQPDQDDDDIVDIPYLLDGEGNAIDSFPITYIKYLDTDKDGFMDYIELHYGSDILESSSTPSDMDGDFIPDDIDTDRDGDCYPNNEDAYPNDSNKWKKKTEDNRWIIEIIIIFVITILIILFLIIKGKKFFDKKNRDAHN